MIRTLLLSSVSLWECMLQSTLFAVVGLVGSIVLRRRPARAHQVLLFATMAAVMVPVLSGVVRHFNLGMFTREVPVPETVGWLEPVAMEGNALAAQYSSGVEPQSLESSAGSFSGIDSEGSSVAWRTVAAWAWLAATVALLGRLFFAFAVGVHLARRAQPFSSSPIMEVVSLAKARLRIAKDLQVRLHEAVRSPVIWCWGRQPILLLPCDLGGFGRRVDWVGVISHELAHWKRRDHVSGLLAELAVCVLPWHPLLWLSKRRLVSLTEQACDDWVIASGQPGEDYAESLLNFKPKNQMAFVPAVVHNSKGVAARVRRILNDTCGNPWAGTRWALTLSLIAICTGVFVAFAQARLVPPEPPTKLEEKPAESLYEAAKAGDIEVVKKSLAEGIDVNAIDKETKMTPLCAAAEGGHTEVVTILLQGGANVELGDSHFTPLYYAIWSDVNATVKALIAGGADVNVLPGRRDYPPLVYAIWQNHADNVRTLLDAGATLSHRDESGCTPLYWAAFTSGGAFAINRSILDMILTRGDYQDTIHLAACQGQLDRVRTLVETGTDVNRRDEFGCTPLQWAVLADSPGVAAFLIARGADIAAKDTMECTALTVARGPAMVDLLLSKGADVNAQTTRSGWTRLHNACFAGDKEVAELLLRKGADANATSRNNMTPLRFAALRGHAELVELLIANGADVNATDNRGRTPLSLARQGKHTGVVEILLKHGAKETLHAAVAVGDIDAIKQMVSQGVDINAKNDSGQTPLHLTCQRGNKEMAELLVANKVNVEAHDDRYGNTALHFAVVSGHRDIVELLIAKGADIEAKNSDGGSPLSLIAGYGGIYARNPQGQHEIMELLIAKGADIESRSFWDCTPLYVAVLQNRPEVAELLMKHGAKLSAMNRFWGTVAHGAMRNGPEMVRWCIKQGIDIPPLHQASYFGEIEKAKSLLSAGANVNQKDIAQFTPLHCASLGHNVEIAQLLIDKGADVEARTCGNYTALYQACQLGDLEMVKLLLRNRADLRTYGTDRAERGYQPADNRTVLHAAAGAGHVEVVEYLSAQGADVQAKCTRADEDGITPLHLAAWKGHIGVARALIAKGADASAKTNKGGTPLSMAQAQARYLASGQALQNYREVIQLLREHGAEE